MHPSEVEAVLKTMKIAVDSREQQTEQSKHRYAQFGVPHYRQKLNFGDYTATFILPDGTEFSLENRVAIERKMNLDEIINCFLYENERFEREFLRARDADAKLYILIEGASWKQAYAGQYRSRIHPNALVAFLLAWLARYNCQIIMVDSTLSGRMIHDILYREAKEILSGMVDDERTGDMDKA